MKENKHMRTDTMTLLTLLSFIHRVTAVQSHGLMFASHPPSAKSIKLHLNLFGMEFVFNE